MSIIDSISCHLGESPVWNPIRKCFHFVDITMKKIFTLNNALQAIDVIEMSSAVGCIVINAEGHLIAACERTIEYVDLDSRKTKVLLSPALSDKEMFNDGKVDAAGRFWVGTKDIELTNPVAALYCYDGNTFTKKLDNLTISNGLDWSLDNQVMYFTDSVTHQIEQFDFDLKSGDIQKRRVFAEVTKGIPDGLTVDAMGNVWGAHWDGSCITCYTPEGNVQDVIELPCKNVTSVAFGGEEFDILLATSAYYGMEQSMTSNDGKCFILDPGIKGRSGFLTNIT